MILKLGDGELLSPYLNTMTILTKIKHMGMCTRMMLRIVHREGARPPG